MFAIVGSKGLLYSKANSNMLCIFQSREEAEFMLHSLANQDGLSIQEVQIIGVNNEQPKAMDNRETTVQRFASLPVPKKSCLV